MNTNKGWWKKRKKWRFGTAKLSLVRYERERVVPTHRERLHLEKVIGARYDDRPLRGLSPKPADFEP